MKMLYIGRILKSTDCIEQCCHTCDNRSGLVCSTSFTTVKSFWKNGRRLLLLKCQFSTLSTYFFEKCFKYFLSTQVPLPKSTSQIYSLCPVLPAALSCDVEQKGSNQFNSINSNLSPREINLIHKLCIKFIEIEKTMPFIFCSFYSKQHGFLYKILKLN